MIRLPPARTTGAFGAASPPASFGRVGCAHHLMIGHLVGTAHPTLVRTVHPHRQSIRKPAMTYSLNLGVMKGALPARAAGGKEQFRLAILGDFSGRALSGQLETGADLAKRKPISVDVDNLDDVLARKGIKLMLPVGAGGGAVEISIGSMDDFHPDQLYDNVEVFSGLGGLRSRLKTNSTFAKAAQEVQSWLGTKVEDAAPVPTKVARQRGAGRLQAERFRPPDRRGSGHRRNADCRTAQADRRAARGAGQRPQARQAAGDGRCGPGRDDAQHPAPSGFSGPGIGLAERRVFRPAAGDRLELQDRAVRHLGGRNGG